MTIIEHNYAPLEPYVMPSTPEHLMDLPVADYDDYRAVADEADSFRKIGLVHPEGYNEAIADSRTIFARVGESLMPVLVPIEHEEGYDHERTKDLTGTPDTFLLTVPLWHVEQDTLQRVNMLGGHGVGDDYAIVIEQPVKHEGLSREDLAARIGVLGKLAVHDFVHEGLRDKEGHETAWMGLYGFKFGPTEEALKNPKADNFEDAWADYREEHDMPELPTEDSTGTFLFTAEQFKQHQQIVDALWEISEIGFGKTLGEYHPVSMEESKAFFESQLFADTTYTAVHYENGVPVCFGSISLDPGNLAWLNFKNAALKEAWDGAKEEGRTPIYFSEIINNGARGMGYGPKVLQLCLDVAGRTQQECQLLFESTNLSATYIPIIADMEVDKAEKTKMHGSIEMIDKLDYWYAVGSNNESTNVS